MDFNYIEKHILKSEWHSDIDENCDVFYNADVEKELTAILAEQIKKRNKRSFMKDLEKCCLDGDICVPTSNKVRLKPSKNKKKPKQKEYFGDMRMENGCEDHIAYIDGKKYRVHKSSNDVPDRVIYTKWGTECVGTVGNYGDIKNIKTRYAKSKTINDIYTGNTYGDGDILTTNKI